MSTPPATAAIDIDPQTPPVDVIRALGFDPDQVRAVVLTADGALAIATDYPEPHTAPEEAP